MDKEPMCVKCESNANSYASISRLNVRGSDLQKNVALIYCSRCGTVYGTVDL